MTNRLLFVSAALLLSASALFAADDYSTWFRYKTNKVDIFGQAFYDPSDSSKTAVAAVSGQKYYIPAGFDSATMGETQAFKGDVLAVDSGSRLVAGTGGRVYTFPELRLLPGGGLNYGSNYHVAGKVVVCGTPEKPAVATPFIYDVRIYEFRANFLGETGTAFRIAESATSQHAKGGVINRTSIFASHPDISGNWEKFYGTLQVATNTYVYRSGTAQNISGKVLLESGSYFGSSLTSGTLTLGGLELQPATEVVVNFGDAMAHPVYVVTNSFAASGNFLFTCTNKVQNFAEHSNRDLVLVRYTGTDENFSCDLSEAQVTNPYDLTKTHPQGVHLEWRDNAGQGCKELVVVPEKPYVIGGLKAMTGWQEAFRLRKSDGTITESDIVLPHDEGVRGECRYRLRITEDGDEQVVGIEDLSPGAYAAAAGYMVQTKADGNSDGTWVTATFGVGKGSTKTNYWADCKWPHSDTNYYSHPGNIRLQNSPVTFGGRSFTLSGYSRTDGEELIVDDMRVLPDSKLHNNNGSNRYKPGTTTWLGTFYHTTVRGNVAVFATTAKPFRLQSCIEAKWNGGFEIFATLLGSSEAAIRGEEYTKTTYGKRWHQVWIKGDTSKYYGLMDVGPNMKLNLCQDGFPEATVRLSTVHSALETMAPSGTVVTVATLDVPTTVAAAGVTPTNATITVASTNVLSVGALSITGQLDKKGEGLFRAGGTATAGSDACLAVNNGFIQAVSANAFNGVKIAFDWGTGIAVDVGEDDLGIPNRGLVDTAIAEPFTAASGKVAVSFRETGDVGKSARDVAVCTVPADSAFADKSKYVLAGKSRKLGALSFVAFGSHGNSDGTVTILAVFTADPGFAIFFK